MRECQIIRTSKTGFRRVYKAIYIYIYIYNKNVASYSCALQIYGKTMYRILQSQKYNQGSGAETDWILLNLQTTDSMVENSSVEIMSLHLL